MRTITTYAVFLEFQRSKFQHSTKFRNATREIGYSKNCSTLLTERRADSSLVSLFSLPPFFSQCFVRRTKRAWTKRNIQTDGLIGETIDWPPSGKFSSIDLRSVGSVNFLYILRALVLPCSKSLSSCRHRRIRWPEKNSLSSTRDVES